MPLDDKTANALADYFSSPGAATALEDRPGPAEGGQGELGTPIAQSGPAAGPPTISDEQAKALADHLDNRPLSLETSLTAVAAGGPFGPGMQWLMENLPLFRTFTKAEAGGYLDTAQGAATLAKSLTDFYRTAVGVPSNDFVDKPLDQVRDQRDRLQAQRDELETNLKTAMDTGKMGGLQVTAASAEINEFQKKIDEANQVLQSGQVKTQPVADTGPLKYLSDSLSALRKTVPQAKPALQEELPTTQELDQSWAGQLASGIGTMGAQVPFMLTDVGQLGFMAQTAGSVYNEAKDKGADDKTAEIAALLDSFGAAAQYSTLELPAARLSNLLKGQTPAKTILDLGRAVSTGSVGMAGLQFYENAIARLSGYDPNRPLDEGVLQQATLGAGLSVLTEGAAKVPELVRYARPAQIEVRERPGTPETETSQPAGERMPVPPPAPQASTDPLAEAAARVQQSQGALAPEQVLEAQGSPEEQLARSSAELSQALRGIGEPATPATPAPTAQAAAAETAPAPVPGSTEGMAPEGRPELAAEPSAELRSRPQPRSPAQSLYDAYAAISAERGRRSVPISDVVQASGVPLDQALEEIRAQKANVQLDEGDWASATPQQRAAAINFRDRDRLLVAFNEEPSGAPMANIRGEAVPPPLPEGPSVTPADVKATTNQAATSMGMDQRVHYVAKADDLPTRVKRAMSQEQLGGTAQTVYDKSMGELWVIGDRFQGTSRHELGRTLINDVLPRVYGGLSDLRIEHNPNDPRLGHYDILADRPVLNEAALMRTANPFEAASKTALEEIVAHQGITKLLGPREAHAYIDSMHGVRQRFDALGLSDILAKEKGFRDLDQMAKAYGFEDYAKNPRHNNALTEELWAAYAQRYGTLARLEEQAPKWYQQAINGLSGALRRRLGLGLSDLDVQNLVADSFGALRRPKWGLSSQFHPEVASQAKNDMRLYQLAAVRGEGEGEGQGQTEFLSQFDKQAQQAAAERIAGASSEPPPLPGGPPASAEALAEAAHARQAAGITDIAKIGDLFVAGERTETRGSLAPGEAIRAQPFKLSSQGNRPFDERMELAKRASAVARLSDGFCQFLISGKGRGFPRW